MRPGAFLLLLLVPGLNACAGYPLTHDPIPLPADESEIGVVLAAMKSNQEEEVLPLPGLTYRRGLNDRGELGITWIGWTVLGEYLHALWRNESLALSGSLGASWTWPSALALHPGLHFGSDDLFIAARALGGTGGGFLGVAAGARAGGPGCLDLLPTAAAWFERSETLLVLTVNITRSSVGGC